MDDMFKDIDNIGKIEPVMESYFGKSKALLEGERILKIMIGKLKVTDNEEFGERSANKGISDWKENDALCKVFQKEFGFKEMYIHWNSEPVENARTWPGGIITMAVGMGSGMPSMPIRDRNNRYYDKNHEYICCVEVWVGLIDMGFTAEELMAVILHEIGHNFDMTLVTSLTKIMRLSSMLLDFAKYPANIGYQINNLLKIIINEMPGPYIKEQLKFIDALMSPFSGVIKIYYKIWNYLNSNSLYLTINRMGVMLMYLQHTAFLVSNPAAGSAAVVGGILGYSGEVFADSFATAYGYGAATVSTEVKFQQNSRQIRYTGKSIAPIKAFNYSSGLALSLLVMMFDPHPYAQTRMKNQINMLQGEMNNPNIPPSIKKALKRDLADAKDIYNKKVLHTEQENSEDCCVAFARMNEYIFNGKLDLRDYVVRVLNLGRTDA